MSVRRKKRPVAVALTTSMGDIAFLLIIFFILASIPKSGRDLTLAEAPGLGELEGTLTVTMDKNSTCWLNDAEITVEGLETAIRNELIKRKESKLVIVKIDKSVPEASFIKVITAVSSAGGTFGASGIETQR